MRWWSLLLALATVVAVALLNAPILYFEQWSLREGKTPVLLDRPARTEGQWVDDYFVVEPLDASTFAIGEPRYYQGNYSYLLVGATRALLIDAGSGLRDLSPVVRALTSLPVTVLPSHLHFDHVGSIRRFDGVALTDVPALRTRAVDGALTLTRYEFLGAMDHLAPPTFQVNEWWADGARVDLGGRTVEILHTPGHTPTSVSVWESSLHRLYAGDYLYPGELYAFLPGASLANYETTANRLLGLLPRDVRVYSAHMQEAPAVPAAPVMGYQDLQALQKALRARRSGLADYEGFYPRRYPVTGSMTLATGFPWNLR